MPLYWCPLNRFNLNSDVLVDSGDPWWKTIHRKCSSPTSVHEFYFREKHVSKKQTQILEHLINPRCLYITTSLQSDWLYTASVAFSSSDWVAHGTMNFSTPKLTQNDVIMLLNGDNTTVITWENMQYLPCTYYSCDALLFQRENKKMLWETARDGLTYDSSPNQTSAYFKHIAIYLIILITGFIETSETKERGQNISPCNVLVLKGR